MANCAFRLAPPVTRCAGSDDENSQNNRRAAHAAQHDDPGAAARSAPAPRAVMPSRSCRRRTPWPGPCFARKPARHGACRPRTSRSADEQRQHQEVPILGGVGQQPDRHHGQQHQHEEHRTAAVGGRSRCPTARAPASRSAPAWAASEPNSVSDRPSCCLMGMPSTAKIIHTAKQMVKAKVQEPARAWARRAGYDWVMLSVGLLTDLSDEYMRSD